MKQQNSNLIIQFLHQQLQKLEEDIKLSQGSSKEKTELKTQMTAAIKNLEFCAEYGLNAAQLEVIRIPEGGSDAYFTEYIIVDEKEINNIDKEAIVRKKGKEIMLNGFDLIVRKKS